MSHSLREIARILEGEVVAGGVNFRAPGHSRGDRSARLLLGSQYPDGFWVISWAGDDPIQLKDYVRDRLGGPRVSSVKEHLNAVHVEPSGEESEKRKRRAASLFNEAGSPIGTPAETYLASRAIRLTADIAGSVLRFHPACPWKERDDEPPIKVPAMVAAMRCIHSGEITGVHRTRLTPDGRKFGRKMLGLAAGSAIKLDAMPTRGLVIGEGIETCLAARQLGFQPVWALGLVGGIERFPVLDGLERLSVLAEDDATGANEKAIATLADRWHDAGRTVLAIASRIGGDINDAIRGAA